jgi:hypothetical protein
MYGVLTNILGFSLVNIYGSSTYLFCLTLLVKTALQDDQQDKFREKDSSFNDKTSALFNIGGTLGSAVA